jgi:uncharacterized repeat protein (TIGR01451 family)
MTNTGDFTLDVYMADDVGNGVLEVVESTITPPSAVYTDGQIVWEDRVSSGQEIVITYEAVVPDTLQPGDMVTNTATANYEVGMASDTARVTVAPDVSAAKYVWDGGLVTEIDGYPTDEILYVLVVTNTGVTDAFVELTDVIPDGLGNVTPVLLPWPTSGMLGYSEFPVPTVFTDTTVLAGTEAYFGYTTTVDIDRMAGDIINRFNYRVVVLDWMTTDPMTVTVKSPLDMSEKAVDPEEANVDDVLEYTITLDNGAPGQGVTATVADTVPDYTSFIAASEGVSHTDGQISWSGPVAAGGQVEITFTVQVTSKVPQYPTEIVNTATVDDGLGNP